MIGIAPGKYTCLQKVNIVFTNRFTCIQTCLHRANTGCLQSCRCCLHIRLQKTLCLRNVYKFTVLFYLVTVIVEFRNLL